MSQALWSKLTAIQHSSNQLMIDNITVFLKQSDLHFTYLHVECHHSGSPQPLKLELRAPVAPLPESSQSPQNQYSRRSSVSFSPWCHSSRRWSLTDSTSETISKHNSF